MDIYFFLTFFVRGAGRTRGGLNVLEGRLGEMVGGGSGFLDSVLDWFLEATRLSTKSEVLFIVCCNLG